MSYRTAPCPRCRRLRKLDGKVVVATNVEYRHAPKKPTKVIRVCRSCAAKEKAA